MTEEFAWGYQRIGVADTTRCEAIATSLAIALGALAVSAGLGAYGAIASGEASADAAEYSAAVERNNAQTAMQQASYEAARIRKRNRLIASKQRAGFLKAGVDISGTADDVMLDSAIEGELDAQAAIYGGRSSASSAAARAKLNVAEAGSARMAGYLGAAGSILGGIGSGASAYVRTRPSNPEF